MADPTHFAKPTADPDALDRAAGQMSHAALAFHTTAAGVKTASAQAHAGWASSNACVAFLSSTGQTHQHAVHAHNQLSATARATRTFARVIREICHNIDGLNRQHDTAAEDSRHRALLTGKDPQSPALTVADIDARLSPQYDELMSRYTRAARTYAAALSGLTTTAADPTAKHTAQDMLGTVGKALGPVAVAFVASADATVKIGMKLNLGKAYITWLTRGTKANIDLARFADSAEGKYLQQAIVGHYEALYKDYPAVRDIVYGRKPFSAAAFNLLSKAGFSPTAIAFAGKSRQILARGGLGLTIVNGINDMRTGGGDKGVHGVLTRVMGGDGAASSAVLLAATGNPVVDGVAVAALLTYGGYSAGNLIYKNRQAIVSTTTKIGKQVGRNAAGNATSDWDALTHPTHILRALTPHF